MILIGTSGWQYDSWKGRFYPRGLKQSEWLPFFAERFPTVEVNNSFYRLPSEAAFDRWRQLSPPGFVLAVKASRYITHVRRLKEPSEPVALLWSRAEALRDRLGPVLFQLPPTMRVDVGRLRALLAVLPAGMRPAFEFRHDSWNTDEVASILDDAGAALVLADRPGLRPREVVTGGWAYLRFHQGGRTGPAYGKRKLERWADRIAALPARDVYVYFNNDTGGAALRDATTLTALLDARTGSVAHTGAA